MRDGRPLLNFKSPRVAQPQQHLADMTMDERIEAVTEMGLPAFRAKQLSTHYFTRYHTDVESMTDLPKDLRAPLA
ncbi:23S rRNA (adenine(2503)-C(2))-methyltransferase RlmN, partial [Burkholderia multivorans]